MEVTIHGAVLIRVETQSAKDTNWLTVTITSDKGHQDELTIFGAGSQPPEIRVGAEA